VQLKRRRSEERNNMKLSSTPFLLALRAKFADFSFGASLPFDGQFAMDTNIKLFRLTENTPEAVSLRTFSFAGGIDSAGTAIGPVPGPYLRGGAEAVPVSAAWPGPSAFAPV
jgi:hypothetical protein